MNNFLKTKNILEEKRQTLDQKKAEKMFRDKVTRYQAAQHLKGNKISYQDAFDILDKERKAAEKEAKKKIAAQKRKNKTIKPKEKLMTDAQFKKMCKGAAADFVGDNSETDLESVVWDIAGSMIYNPDVKKYVLKKMSKNSGRPEDQIKDEMVIEYIADSIHSYA